MSYWKPAIPPDDSFTKELREALHKHAQALSNERMRIIEGKILDYVYWRDEWPTLYTVSGNPDTPPRFDGVEWFCFELKSGDPQFWNGIGPYPVHVEWYGLGPQPQEQA